MAKEFSFSVVAPDRSVVEATAVGVIAPGSLGYFGVLAGHEPMVVSLRPGLLEYTEPSGRRCCVAIGGGFAEVSAGRVTILADSAALATEVDIKREEENLERARKALRGEDTSMTSEEAVQELESAMARIRAARTGK